MMDAYALWESHERELDRQLLARPVCDCCGERIQDEWYFELPGETLCEDCLKDKYRKNTYDED